MGARSAGVQWFVWDCRSSMQHGEEHEDKCVETSHIGKNEGVISGDIR